MGEKQTRRRKKEPDVWAGRGGVDIDRDELKDRGRIKGGGARRRQKRQK